MESRPAPSSRCPTRPLDADLRGLPPLLVQAAADAPEAHDAIALSRLARVAGVAVDLDLWMGVWHAWHYHDLPEADRALAEVRAFVARR